MFAKLIILRRNLSKAKRNKKCTCDSSKSRVVGTLKERSKSQDITGSNRNMQTRAISRRMQIDSPWQPFPASRQSGVCRIAAGKQRFQFPGIDAFITTFRRPFLRSFLAAQQFFYEINLQPFRHGNGDCQSELATRSGFLSSCPTTIPAQKRYRDKIYFPPANKNYRHFVASVDTFHFRELLPPDVIVRSIERILSNLLPAFGASFYAFWQIVVFPCCKS